MKPTSILLSCLICLSFSNTPAIAEESGELVRIKSTRFSLVPPSGFKPSKRFQGFINEAKSSTIMVTELPAPSQKLISGFTAENLATKKMTLISRKPMEVSGYKGVLINLDQMVGPAKYMKWITVFGDATRTVMVVGVCPIDKAEELSDQLKASVKSIKWNATGKIDKTEGLNFSIKPAGSLKLAHRIQKMLLFTSEGKFPSTSPDDAIFVVGESFNLPPMVNKKAFCVARMKKSNTVKDIKETEVKDLTKDGKVAFEVLAEGTDKKSGEKLFLYQVIIFDKESYFIQQGVVSDKKRADVEPIFREMSDSFRIRA